jgi:hypothetical protein
MREAAIAGIGRTPYGKASGRTPPAMAAAAAREALAGGDVDGVAEFQTGDSARALEVAAAIGADDLSWALDISGGGNVACTTVAEGFAAVSRGACEVAVVYRSLNGEIYSYIVIRHPSVPAFAHLLPYEVALVELAEEVRLPGRLVGIKPAEVRIGQRVMAEFETLPGATAPAVVFRVV